MKRILLLLFLGGLFPVQAHTQPVGAPQRFDPDALLRHVEVLAADSMEGRKTGTPGAGAGTGMS